jgi:hypothetical protein
MIVVYSLVFVCLSVVYFCKLCVELCYFVYQIARDLMFRRFIDSSLSEAAPDHSTIWRFRQLLNTENLLEPLLEQINHHLEQKRFMFNNKRICK